MRVCVCVYRWLSTGQIDVQQAIHSLTTTSSWVLFCFGQGRVVGALIISSAGRWRHVDPWPGLLRWVGVSCSALVGRLVYVYTDRNEPFRWLDCEGFIWVLFGLIVCCSRPKSGAIQCRVRWTAAPAEVCIIYHTPVGLRYVDLPVLHFAVTLPGRVIDCQSAHHAGYHTNAAHLWDEVQAAVHYDGGI